MKARARLEWRCRRGIRELDLLLQTWLSQAYDTADPKEQAAFLELLEWRDDQLCSLLFGRSKTEDPGLNELAGKIRALSLPCP